MLVAGGGKKKRFHSNIAKMPVYFYKGERVTFILENKFFLHKFSMQKKALKVHYSIVSGPHAN